jgi:hypothetical protein
VRARVCVCVFMHSNHNTSSRQVYLEHMQRMLRLATGAWSFQRGTASKMRQQQHCCVLVDKLSMTATSMLGHAFQAENSQSSGGIKQSNRLNKSN